MNEFKRSAKRRSESRAGTTFNSAVAISDAACPMRWCQPLLATVGGIPRSTTDDVFDVNRCGPHDAVVATPRLHPQSRQHWSGIVSK